MGCENDQVTIQPGRNLWVLVRTDRDGADLDDVLLTTGGVLKRFLGRASPPGTRGIFEVLQSPKDSSPHMARFVIGAARPVLVDAFQASSSANALGEQPKLGKEVQTDYFAQCPTPRTITQATNRPWFVSVEFDWRAPAAVVDWPHRAVNFLGIPFDSQFDNDWLLVAAGHRGPPEESDTSLLGEVSDETKAAILKALRKARKAAEDAASEIAPIIIGLAVIVGGGTVVYLASKYGPDRRRPA